MTGGEGSKPVYSYNRKKRVNENAYVRRASENAYVRRASRLRKTSAKKKKKTKKSSRTARLRIELNRMVRRFYG